MILVSFSLYCAILVVQVSCGLENTAYIVQETVGQVQACVSVPSNQLLQFDFNLTILTVEGSASKYCLRLLVLWSL